MADLSKRALETFLTGVAHSDPARKYNEPVKKGSATEARRSAILVILDQAGEPMPNAILAKRSELAPQAYKDVMAGLREDGLISQDGSGYALTERGRELAQSARRRLLSF